MNMKNTVENPSFMTYMGVGKSDIRIDIQYSEKLAEQKDAALSYLENDSEITKYAIYQNGYVQFENTDGDLEYLRVENGDERDVYFNDLGIYQIKWKFSANDCLASCF
jgi:putative ABC transport system permease protein